MGKREQLENLHKEWESKSLPLRKDAHNMVWGQGNLNSKIYMLGEAPGKFEDLQGKPFVGPAGRLLDKLLGSIGLKRENVFISNLVRFRPPENRDPKPEEIDAFEQSVDEEIKIIDPKIIVTVGRFSLNKFLPNAKISQVHGKVFQVKWKGKNLMLIPIYHPAAALRRIDIKKQIKKDFQVIKKMLI